jgi:hypothetical protein
MSNTATQELGPIDYVVIEFPPGTQRFDGAMATELAALIDAELVRILDLVIMTTDENGVADVLEVEDLADDDALGHLRVVEGAIAEVLALEDLEHVAGALEPGAVAAVIVWENTWAAPFAEAARKSGGQLVASGRISTEALLATLQADETEGD